MSDWWNTLPVVHQAFWVTAMIFSLLFLIQFALGLLDFENEAGAREETDFHAHPVDTRSTIFSVRNIIAFLTFFGWGGIVALNVGGSTKTAVVVAGLAGFTAMFVVAYVMFWFSKFSQKRNIDFRKAIFKTGKVHLPIPANGRGQGKIQINIGGSLKEIDAISKGRNLPSGSTVRVIEVINDNVLVVEKVEGFLPHEIIHPRK